MESAAAVGSGGGADVETVVKTLQDCFDRGRGEFTVVLNYSFKDEVANATFYAYTITLWEPRGIVWELVFRYSVFRSFYEQLEKLPGTRLVDEPKFPRKVMRKLRDKVVQERADLFLLLLRAYLKVLTGQARTLLAGFIVASMKNHDSLASVLPHTQSTVSMHALPPLDFLGSSDSDCDPEATTVPPTTSSGDSSSDINRPAAENNRMSTMSTYTEFEYNLELPALGKTPP